MNKFLSLLLACLVAVSCSVTVFAEDPPPDGSSRVPVELDNEALAAAIAAALADILTTSPEEPVENLPAPDYSAQLSDLRQELVEIKTAVQATPEQAEPEHIWDKPFDEYTPLEGLLLVGVVLLAFVLLTLFLR